MKLQYLTILLDDSSVPFCAYDSSNTHNLIKLSDLKCGIEYAINNDLYLQIAYPEYALPEEYTQLLSSVEHIVISSYESASVSSDIVVLTKNVEKNAIVPLEAVYIIKINSSQLSDLYNMVKAVYQSTSRINIILSDIENFSEVEFDLYKQQLEKIRNLISVTDIKDVTCQINVLTDLLFISNMNNCNAGLTSITLAPNGKLYICPAFYYSSIDFSCGDVREWKIKNQQLLKLDNAPICLLCDAYHCKRCLYKNFIQTLEINTPSYEQCYISHIEREQSRLLNQSINGKFRNIKEIDYMDPFEKITKQN